MTRTSLIWISLACIPVVVASGAAAQAEPGDKVWTRVIGGTYYASTEQATIASNGRVYVTGTTDYWRDSEYRYTTAAYSSSGRLLWLRRYDSGSASNTPTSMALGPSERRLYVTGVTDNYKENPGSNWMTVAYRADGTKLWVARYNGPASRNDAAASIAVSPTGRVFVTGYGRGGGTGSDITTIAYDPDGDRLWTRRYDGGQKESDGAASVLVGPSGHHLYVAGHATTEAGNQDLVLISYRANGTLSWRRQLDVTAVDAATASALGPSGRHVYATGRAGDGFVTAAYRRDGQHLWTRLLSGDGNGSDTAKDIQVAPDGRTVFVTGTTQGEGDTDVTTVAYSDVGKRLWTTAYDSGRNDTAVGLAVNPRQDEVYLVASHNSISTAAYNFLGEQLWSRDVYWSNEGAAGHDVAASPDGQSVVVTGPARDVYWNDALVIKYSTR